MNLNIFFIGKSKNGGFSLVELLMAMTMVLFVLGLVSTIIIGMNSQLKSQRSRLESFSNSQAAADSMVRVIRMAGSRPTSCDSTFVPASLNVSTPVTGGYFAVLKVQSDWNSPDCTLNGVDEDVTYSVKNNILYIDANQVAPFADNISAVRFMLFDENNLIISNPSLAAGAKFIRIEIDTVPNNGAVTTIVSGATVRK